MAAFPPHPDPHPETESDATLRARSEPVRWHWASFGFGGLSAGLIAGLLFILYRAPEPPPIVLHPPPSPAPTATALPTSTPAPWVVYLSGAVQQPGLYRVTAGARVGDVLALGGGLAQDAAPDALNLAEPVYDGARVHVAHNADRNTAPQNAGELEAGAGVSGAGVSGATLPTPTPAPTSAPTSAETASAGDLVNVNTATQAELETLPSIGPARAQAIIDNRPYAAVDDLTRVPGIGEGILNQLRDRVTVE